MRDHRKLKAFELADQLVIAVYKATRAYPREELFGLTSQMRRSAVSVPANIVEGCARNSENDFLRFLDIALVSLRELGYYIDLSKRLDILVDANDRDLVDLCEESSRVLAGLIQSLRNRS